MSFARPSPEAHRARRQAEREANLRALCVPVSEGARGVYRTSAECRPQPKDPVKAKPGKRTQNAAEKRWIGAIVAHGCVACRLDGHGYVPPEVHHILRGGVRLGHLFSIPLCSGHHRKGAGRPGLIARHPDKARFEAKYGPEQFLLAKLQAEIGDTK